MQVASYRGLETPFEYLWLLADDILIHCSPETADDPGHCTAYGCTDPTKFASPADTSTAIPAGYERITELPTAEGYQWNFGFSYDGFTFPTSVGGGANQGLCDYFGAWQRQQLMAGTVPSCLLLRIMERMRASVICMRLIVPRTRVRTVASACAVFNGTAKHGSRSNENLPKPKRKTMKINE